MQNISRRGFVGAVAGGLAGLGLQGCATRPVSAAKRKAGDRPNFVIIFTDDQGYNDLGCFGSPKIKTPNIDRMAAEGARFTDFYVTAPMCTPSRASLLTGCYPLRTGLTRVIGPRQKVGLREDQVTIAGLLKPRGYATACIGKWHLGWQQPFLPTRHGFDYYFGLPYSNDMGPSPKNPDYPPLPLYRNEEIIEQPADQNTLTQCYTEEAVAFIRAHRDQPFFLYLPHTMPHTPLHVSERFRGTSERGLYGDVIEEIDWSTGRILEAIKGLGLDENTLVIFTSDNGPWLIRKEDGGSAYPLRLGKGTTFEGGVREPCVMRWPGHIPAGAVCREAAITIDFLPTLAKLAAATVPKGTPVDGKDIWPLMSGQAGAVTPHEVILYYKQATLEAVRCGDWKLHVARFVPQAPGGELIEPQLYNLAEDIGEANNLAAARPDVVASISKHLDAIRADLGDAATGTRGRGARPPGSLEE